MCMLVIWMTNRNESFYNMEKPFSYKPACRMANMDGHGTGNNWRSNRTNTHECKGQTSGTMPSIDTDQFLMSDRQCCHSSV